MISKEKYKFLYEYDKPIIWNLSCFGNENQMFIFDNFLDILERNNISNPISTIHGSYSCKYNGGRAAIYWNSKTNIENKIRHYNNKGIGIKLTFSNSFIHKDTFEEEEMRWYLDLLNETKGIGNGIICVNDDFAELVKKNYPDLDLVSSHVKVEMETEMGKTDTPDYYNSKFDLYDIVVCNTYRAFDDNFLQKITYPEKLEFIVNRSCTTNCPMAKYHHELIEKIQERKSAYNNNVKLVKKDLEYNTTRNKVKELLNKCINIKYQNTKEKLQYQFINKEEINYLANTYNITKFKIEGRDLSTIEFLTNLSRFIINKESYYDFIYNEKNFQFNDEYFKTKFID